MQHATRNTHHALHQSGSGHEVKAVIFDLGETILNFGKINHVRLFRQGARLSYDYLKSHDQPVGNFGIYFWRNLFIIRFKTLISAITGKDINSTAFLRALGLKKGIHLNSEQWRHFSWLWYEPLSKEANVEPDIKQTLSKLKNAKLKLGILSNTFVSKYSIEKQLEEIGILDFFSVRMYSYEFDFRKPDLRIFKIAAERIGEPLENIMYIGDRIDKDAKPTLELGMKSVIKTAYTNTGKSIPEGALKIKTLSELPDLIEKINI